MTSQKAQIQALINGIDEVLSKNSPRLPWVMSNDALQQRQVLEQTRQYLTALQQQIDDERLTASTPEPSAASPSSESAQQVLQAVLQEMNYWRVNMLQPLRTEVDTLQRQREILTQEIRQLEAQRQQYGLPNQPNQRMLMEFLQSAMAQMQANLSGQVTQMIANLSPSQMPVLPSDRSEPQLAALTPAERLAQMQKVQSQSDQLMLKLDSTLQVIFESLNRNVQTYQDSLEQGLSRMHSLGQQGEAMFAFLVNRLAQQLGREASSFLQSSTSEWQQQPSLPANSEANSSDFRVADFLSQVPAPQSQPESSTIPFNLSEEVLDISELDLAEDTLPESDNLAALDQALSQLDLNAIATEPATESFDLFAGDQPMPTTLEAEFNPAESPEPATAPISDLDSALDLLNQLSAEMQAGIALNEPASTPPSSPSQPVSEVELITAPDSLYDDAFYNNLFQESDVASDRPIADTPGPQPESELTLEQEWFAGLSDPAAQPEQKPTVQPEFSAGSVNQSLETFLLNGNAPVAPSGSDLFADFSEPESAPIPGADAPSGPPATEAPVETIASLADLISEPISIQPPALETDTSAAETSTVDIQALIESSLPVAEAPTETFDMDLGLTLESLEQLGSSAPAEPAAWDFLDASSPAEPSAPAPTELPVELPPAPVPMTIEGLEGLFEEVADLGTPPHAASADPTDPFTDLFTQFEADAADTDSEKKN